MTDQLWEDRTAQTGPWSASRGKQYEGKGQLPDRLHDVGPGWSGILTRLHETAIALGALSYTVGDVKEKFGALRLYLDDVPAELSGPVEAAVDTAEEESRAVCEYCGQPGTWRNTGYWGKTACDACAGTW